METNEPRWTYKTEDAVYDVTRLSEEAQISFTYLVEVEGEIQTLAKRIDILKAAASKFHEILKGSLLDEAIINEGDVEEGEVLEEEET
jgi:hypothetical protein|tara:strand:- start:446 stop:709 length:264 start_codon:yes stop_codon:yes gene_type:complete